MHHVLEPLPFPGILDARGDTRLGLIACLALFRQFHFLLSREEGPLTDLAEVQGRGAIRRQLLLPWCRRRSKCTGPILGEVFELLPGIAPALNELNPRFAHQFGGFF